MKNEQNARILHEICPENFSRFLGWGGGLPHCSPSPAPMIWCHPWRINADTLCQRDQQIEIWQVRNLSTSTREAFIEKPVHVRVSCDGHDRCCVRRLNNTCRAAHLPGHRRKQYTLYTPTTLSMYRVASPYTLNTRRDRCCSCLRNHRCNDFCNRCVYSVYVLAHLRHHFLVALRLANLALYKCL